MKRLLAIIFLALVLYVAYLFFFKTEKHSSEPKPEALKVTKHSKEFNQSILNCVNGYISMKNAFTDGDMVKIKSESQKFITITDTLKLDELHKNDSTIFLAAQQELSDIKANTQAILQENNANEMREDFRMVSENLYPFLKTIAYEGPKLYWKSCATAFGEDKAASWISDTSEIINPYFTKDRPDDKLCGEIKDSL